jgi:lauroyl/myristoyl acyltransferase
VGVGTGRCRGPADRAVSRHLEAGPDQSPPSVSRAFPELSQAGIERIVAGMRDNLGRVAAEYPHLHEIRVFASNGCVETYGFEHMDRAI